MELSSSRLSRVYQSMFSPRTTREEGDKKITDALLSATNPKSLRTALSSRVETKGLKLSQVKDKLADFYEKKLEDSDYPTGGFTESGFPIDLDEIEENEVAWNIFDNYGGRRGRFRGEPISARPVPFNYKFMTDSNPKFQKLKELKDKPFTLAKEFNKLRLKTLKNVNKLTKKQRDIPERFRRDFDKLKTQQRRFIRRSELATAKEEELETGLFYGEPSTDVIPRFKKTVEDFNNYGSVKKIFRQIAKLEVQNIKYPFTIIGTQKDDPDVKVQYVLDKGLTPAGLTQSLYYHLNVYPTTGLDASNYSWTITTGNPLDMPTTSLNTTITGEKFKDSEEGHCFYDSLIDYLKSRMLPTNSEKTNQRYRLIIEKAIQLREIDKFGVPYLKLQERANALPIQIIFKDIEGKVIETYTPNRNYNSISFSYVRTRPNHLEANLDFSKPEFTEEKSEEELLELYETMRKKNIFGLVEYTKEFPPKIKAINDGKTLFKKINPEAEIINENIDLYAKLRNTLTLEQYNYFKTGMSVPYQRSIWYPSEYITQTKTITKEEEKPLEEDPLELNEEELKELKEWEEQRHLSRLFRPELLSQQTFNYTYELKDLNLVEKDMKRAYSQFNLNPYYEKCKFPAIPTDYCSFDCFKPTEEWLENHNGVFTFSAYLSNHKNDELDFSADLHYIKWFLDRVGFKTDGTLMTRTNIQMLFLMEVGCEIRIHKGLFTTVKTDFQFTDLVMTNKLYARMTGIMDYSPSLTKTYQIIPNDHITPDFLKSIQPTLKGKINIFNKIGMPPLYTYTIDRPSEIVSNHCHISAFIYDYCFTSVLHECFRHKLKNIVALKLDSIVYIPDTEGEETNISATFRPKELKLLNTLGQPFITSYDYENHIQDLNLENTSPYDEAYDKQYILCNGMGGCGKTTTIGNRKGIINPIACALQWTNATSLQRTFNIEGHSVARMIGENETINQDELEKGAIVKETKKIKDYFHFTKRNRHPPNLIVDEITMLKSYHFQMLTKKYPFSKIYFCGDFSLKTFKPFQTYIDDHGGHFIKNNLKKFSLVPFTTDYRAKDCPALQKLKLQMRDIMEENPLEVGEDKLIMKTLDLLNKTLSTNCLETIKLKHSNGDKANIIVSTNGQSDLISNSLNWPHVKITSHSFTDIGNAKSGKESYLRGQIYKFIPEIEQHRYEVRSAFTIHSFQGMTIPKDEMLYIDTNRTFQIQLLYTAISRAQNISQIRLISDIDSYKAKKPIKILSRKTIKIGN